LAAVEDDADVSTLRNAVVQRIAFWGRAMSVGARWTWDLLDKTARIFAVVAILAVSVGGVLLHQPAAVIGGVLGALAVFSFAEGTYCVARDAKQGATTSPDDTTLWLSIRVAQGNLLLEHWAPHASHDVERESVEKAAKWEQEARFGLVGRLPAYLGLFGLDVGLGPEFAPAQYETNDRARLRRRIHRLAEIAERYGREQSQ
jgi:hypothetical protein